MKKHHKLNLDELADEMEGISRQEQESSAGGEVYVSPEGQYLGETSGNSYMVIISSGDYNQFRNSGSETLNRYSTSFAFLSPDDQARVLSGMAGAPCQVYGNSGSISEQGRIFDTDPDAFGFTRPDYIGMNSYGQVMRSNNYWDILSILRHEGCHYNQTHTDIHSMEAMAVWAPINDPYFNRCSPEFQDAFMRTYHYYLTGVYW